MLESVKLHSALQALDVGLKIDGRPLRAIVTADFCEAHLGASREPASWLQAFYRHEEQMKSLIRRKALGDPVGVVLIAEIDGPLR